MSSRAEGSHKTATVLGALAVLAAIAGVVAGGGAYETVLHQYTGAPAMRTNAPAGVRDSNATAKVYARAGAASRAEPPAGLAGGESLSSAETRRLEELVEREVRAPARTISNFRESDDAGPDRSRVLADITPAAPAPAAEPSFDELPAMDVAPETGAASPSPPMELAQGSVSFANRAAPAAAFEANERAAEKKRRQASNPEIQPRSTTIAAAGRSMDQPLAKGSITEEAFTELKQELTRLDRVVPVASDRARAAAARFLAAQRSLAGLDFKDPTGYWANTYVPGDAEMRVLESRLRGWDRQHLAALGAPRLERAARQNPQPFDAPDDAALATYLRADRAALEGPGRLRVQVGLTATARRSGLRPAMNIAVVLDLRRTLDDATAARLRALVMAVARARQPGDRFFLVSAGRGDAIVEPASFRHGPLGIAMDELLERDGDASGSAPDLAAAMRTAADRVRQGEDSDRPLGASLVLLAATSPLGAGAHTLDQLVHANAVDGIALSVVAVSHSVPMDEVDRLVLLGQGQRSVLDSAADAPRVVERELHASSRAVARAVRLRIRFAPGVRLVDVLGSHRLDEVSAERVRQAEQSIDQRLARHLGIRADRGDDEEGIQIVIPAFYAGDDHAVLLDVVAPGAGPVADVTVRYKDLVYRRNGVARANLSLPAGARTAGPLERNVLKNRLAFEVASTARDAAARIRAGDWSRARALLAGTSELVAGMRALVPGFADDAELAVDEQMLAEYVTVIDDAGMRDASERRHVVDSLRLLAFRRLVPPRL